MTLIITHLSKHGIIHASDSNLTTSSGKAAGGGKKTFNIPSLNAGLTVAGVYSVGNVSMDKWMTSFIDRQSHTSISLFADSLKNELENAMTQDEKDEGTIIHLSGYALLENRFHPELWHIRNVRIDSDSGEYENIDGFRASEDFWSRDCLKSNLMQEFQRGSYQLYVNGFASGRTSFMILQPIINDFFSVVWSNSKWKFRPPVTINETEYLVKLYLQIIGTLFRLSDYSAPFIGGDSQTYSIPQPKNTVTSCPE